MDFIERSNESKCTNRKQRLQCRLIFFKQYKFSKKYSRPFFVNFFFWFAKKAHQRSDRPRFSCQICGKDFQKRIALRHHEQLQHGVHNSDAGIGMIDSPRIR